MSPAEGSLVLCKHEPSFIAPTPHHSQESKQERPCPQGSPGGMSWGKGMPTSTTNTLRLLCFLWTCTRMLCLLDSAKPHDLQGYCTEKCVCFLVHVRHARLLVSVSERLAIIPGKFAMSHS